MWQFSYTSGMRVISIDEFHDNGWRWAAEEACIEDLEKEKAARFSAAWYGRLRILI